MKNTSHFTKNQKKNQKKQKKQKRTAKYITSNHSQISNILRGCVIVLCKKLGTMT